MTAYDTDTYAWSREQADAIRRRSWNEIDWDNVAEEIESVGKSEKRELSSRLEVLVMHLLKWSFQPGARSGSWRATIMLQRAALDTHLGENPSLRPLVSDVVDQIYRQSRLAAAAETHLPVDAFPDRPPFSAEQILGEEFWPEAPAG